MAWYKSGTASVVNGSDSVTLAGADAASNIFAEDGFFGPDGRLYEVKTVNSATSITLSTNYVGPTASAQAYRIVPTADYFQLREALRLMNDLISQNNSMLEGPGSGIFPSGTFAAPAIRNEEHLDSGFIWNDDGSISVVVSGVVQMTFSAEGVVFWEEIANKPTEFPPTAHAHSEYAALTGAAFTGAVSVPAPSASNHAVTRAYLEGIAAGLQATSAKGAANGYAGLDAAGKVPANQLPAISLTEPFVVSTQAAMLALDAQAGDVAVRTDVSRTFMLKQSPASTLANWIELLMPTAGSGVTSVGLSAPTGFSVSGSPVTSTGTLTFTYASGYEGFTTALKNTINAAMPKSGGTFTGLITTNSGITMGRGQFLTLAPGSYLSTTSTGNEIDFVFDSGDHIRYDRAVNNMAVIIGSNPELWVNPYGVGIRQEISSFASSNGQVTLANSAIEIGKTGRTTAGAAIIDLHSSANSPDYDVRIYALGGSSAASGQGNIIIEADNFRVSSDGITYSKGAIQVTDGGYAMFFSGGNPLLGFDGGDYFVYNRTSNTLNFMIGNTSRLAVSDGGVYDGVGKLLCQTGKAQALNNPTFYYLGEYFYGTGGNVTLDVAYAHNCTYINNGAWTLTAQSQIGTFALLVINAAGGGAVPTFSGFAKVHGTMTGAANKQYLLTSLKVAGGTGPVLSIVEAN